MNLAIEDFYGNVNQHEISEKKIFQYPVLFQVDIDGDMQTNILDEIQFIDCDYIFESVISLSCEVFQKAFQWKTIEPKEIIHEYQYQDKIWKTSCIHKNIIETNSKVFNSNDNPELHTYEWFYDKENLEKLSIEFKKMFEGNMVPVGKTFTEHLLFYGNIGSYYVQYLANGLFGHPHAVVGISNKNEIIDIFKTLHNQINKHIQDKNYFEYFAQQLRNIFVEKEPKRWIDNDETNDFPFEQGDILEFFIRIEGNIKNPILENRTLIGNHWNDLIKNTSICNNEGELYPKILKIRFILL